MFGDSDYPMIPEGIRHEMKQIACMASVLIKLERKARHQILLRKILSRSFDIIDALNNELLRLRKEKSK